MTSQQKITMNNLNKKNIAKNYYHPLTGTQHCQLTTNHHWQQTENQCQPTENNHWTTANKFMLLRICNIWYQGLKTDVLWNFYGYKSKIAPFSKNDLFIFISKVWKLLCILTKWNSEAHWHLPEVNITFFLHNISPLYCCHLIKELPAQTDQI